jgi:hypothetical protein
VSPEPMTNHGCVSDVSWTMSDSTLIAIPTTH